MKGLKHQLVRVCALFVFLFSVIAGTITFDGGSPFLVEAKSKGFVYNPKVPLPEKQQSYLYQLCQKRGLDYKETLAVIKQESNFRPYARNGGSYGLFQIHKVNHAYLSKKLKTQNKPLDPYVNMNWGTYMLSDLTKKFYKKGYRNEKLKEAVLSAYNKGEYGYQKTGKAVDYIKAHNRALAMVKSWFS